MEEPLCPKFFHHHYKDTSATTVCVLCDGDHAVSRGVAICSPIDQFVKKKGRNIAYGRAVKAVVRNRASLPVHQRELRYPNQAFTDVQYLFKSQPMPVDTKLPWEG